MGILDKWLGDRLNKAKRNTYPDLHNLQDIIDVDPKDNTLFIKYHHGEVEPLTTIRLLEFFLRQIEFKFVVKALKSGDIRYSSLVDNILRREVCGITWYEGKRIKGCFKELENGDRIQFTVEPDEYGLVDKIKIMRELLPVVGGRILELAYAYKNGIKLDNI